MEFDKVYVNWIGDDEAFLLLRSAGFKGARRMQEGNKAYKPSMWTREDDWPSIVFEVDVCETMAQLQTTAWLQQDAQFWLDFFRGETRIVIIICVNQNARSMEIQRWQAEAVGVAPIRQQPIRHMQRANPYARRYVAICVQSLDLAEGQNYAGASLHIPAHLIYDNLPLGLGLGPNDFNIIAQILNEFNTDYWLALQ